MSSANDSTDSSAASHAYQSVAEIPFVCPSDCLLHMIPFPGDHASIQQQHLFISAFVSVFQNTPSSRPRLDSPVVRAALRRALLRLMPPADGAIVFTLCLMPSSCLGSPYQASIVFDNYRPLLNGIYTAFVSESCFVSIPSSAGTASCT